MTVMDNANKRGDVFFVSFADSKLRKSLKRIKRQARQFKCFRRIYVYDEKKLPRYGIKRIEEIMRLTGSTRGFGYWSWKPVVILDVLNKIKQGDVLFYTDAGTHLNAKGEAIFLEYVDRAVKNDIWVTQLNDSFSDLSFTKKDTIDLFAKSLSDPDVLRSGQVQAGIIILVKNEYTCKVISEWNELMSAKNVHYFDDSPSILPNDPSFVENRHDQSLFSLLLKSNHFYPETECQCYSETEEGWKKLAETEPILVKRDKQWGVGIWKTIKRRIKSILKAI